MECTLPTPGTPLNSPSFRKISSTRTVRNTIRTPSSTPIGHSTRLLLPSKVFLGTLPRTLSTMSVATWPSELLSPTLESGKLLLFIIYQSFYTVLTRLLIYLRYWRPILQAFKSYRNRTQPDPHYQLMRVYKEVPMWVYGAIMVASFACAMATCCESAFFP